MAVYQGLTVSEVSTNVAANNSKVRILWTSTQTGESMNLSTRTAYYYVSINGGAETQYSVSYTLPKGATQTILDTTITVPHRDDGTGTVKVRTRMDTRISAGVVEQSREIALTTLARETTLDSVSCATSYFTGKLTCKYTPKSSSFYNSIDIILLLDEENVLYVKEIQLGQKDTSQQTATVTLSDSELEEIYNALPNATKGVLRIELGTYSEPGYNTPITEEPYKDLTLNIPDDATTKATVSMSLTPVHSLPPAFSGLYIQGKTKVKADLSADFKFNATILSYSMKVEGTDYYSASDYTSEYLSNYGDIKVYGYATDTRGFTGSTSTDITVLAYSKPRITVDVCGRCDEYGNLSDNGTYLKIKATRSYSTVTADGEQKNFCQIRYRYRVASASSYSAWKTILDSSDVSTNTVETGALLGGVLAPNTSYVVQVQAIDDVGDSAESLISVPTEAVHTHRTRNGIGFGKYCEGDNLMDVAWDAHFHGEVLIGGTGMTLKEYILAVISEGG